jgi:hypothetical protein
MIALFLTLSYLAFAVGLTCLAVLAWGIGWHYLAKGKA